MPNQLKLNLLLLLNNLSNLTVAQRSSIPISCVVIFYTLWIRLTNLPQINSFILYY